MDDTQHGATEPDSRARRTKSRQHTTIGTKEAEHPAPGSDLRAALQAAELRAEAAERQVRRIEARFAALVSTSKQWMWTSDSNGNAEVDTPVRRMFARHYETNEQQHDWTDAIHPDDRERTLTAWAKAVATRSIYENVHRMCDANGVYHTLLVRAVPTAEADSSAPEWLGISTDITDQVAQLEREHAARAEAEAVKAQLQAILDVLPLGLVIADAKGRLIMSNPAVYRIWGDDAPTLDDVSKYSEYKGHWPHSGQRMESKEWALARSLLDGEVVIGEEVAIETFDGERKTILNSTAPIRDASGTIVGAVAAMLDITERKRLEHETLERAAQLDAMFEALGDGIAIFDNQGRALRMNAAARAMQVFNVDPSEDVARSASEQDQQPLLCDADGRPLPLEQWPRFRVVRGEVLQGNTAMDLITRSRDGRAHYITSTGAPIRDADGHILGGVVAHRDETQRKQLELALRASMEAARHRAREVDAILNAITDGILFYNAEGRLISANAAAHRLLAGAGELSDVWTLPERTMTFIARALDGTILTPEQHPFARILRGEVLTGSNTVEIETHRLDGSPITISVSGAPLRDERGALSGAVCVLRDVTERLSLEKALREREAMFRGTFEQAAVGMAHTALDGHWLRVNDRICAITGYTREEMLTSRFRDITHPDDLEVNLGLARDLVAGKIPNYTMEKRYIRKNGQHIWVHLTVALARTANGAPSYFISVIEDISARKVLEQQRSDLLGIVAHDLSNPLTVMKSWLQVLHRQLAAGKMPEVSTTRAAEIAVKRMERLVGDLRDTTSADTRQLTLKIAPFDLVALCRVEAEAQMQMYNGRDIDLILPNESVMAEIDSDRIARVLGNLLSNAIKYSPSGQPITLSLERHDEPSANGPARAGARIAVRDHGIGIAPDAQRRIFDKFYRVPGVNEEQRMQPSLGLGLYICRTLVEEHGGAISVESIPGQGSTFIFTLPLTHKKHPAMTIVGDVRNGTSVIQ